MKNVDSILLQGYSSRAPAWSVVRAGITPIINDQCRDLDLPGDAIYLSETHRWAKTNPAVPFLPTGGWENRLSELAAIEKSRLSLGTPSGSIRRVRDPILLQRTLEQHGFPALRIRTSTSEFRPAKGAAEARTTQWIRKPYQSMGGLGVCLSSELPVLNDTRYFNQQFVSGPVYSAQFVTPLNAAFNQTIVLGLTQQLSGPRLPGDAPFTYLGNLGPVTSATDARLVPELVSTLTSIGTCLAKAFDLRGLWGIDFVIDDNQVYVLEVNPRYTAAVELLELAGQRSLLGLLWESNVGHNKTLQPASHVIGKSTVYASSQLNFASDWNWNRLTRKLADKDWLYDAWSIPVLSDLPRPGTMIGRSDPVCTVWAVAETVHDCRNQLADRTAIVTKAFQAMRV